MQVLETEVGGQLMERGRSGVALTAAGHALLEGKRAVVARADISYDDFLAQNLKVADATAISLALQWG